MTEQVRTTYRSHRKATWAMVLGLAVLVTAVVIPFASGAADKTFTLSIAPACTGASTTVTLRNTAQSQTLGSIQIYFPAGSIGTPPPSGWTRTPNATSQFFTGTRDILSRDNLNLAKGATTTVVVPLTANAPSGEVSAVGKQANKFNDSGGGANLFERNPSQTSWPRLESCARIEGRVYHDRDQSGAFAVNASSPTSDVKKPGWIVTLTDLATLSVASDTSDADGRYDFTAAVGRNYRLCVRAPNAPDNGIPWSVRQIDPPVALVAGCSLITPSSPASSGISVAPLTAAGKTGQDFAVVPVTVLDFEGGDTAGPTNYVVTAGGDSTKVAQHYTQETFTSNGRPFFIFAPINACTGCGQIYLLEELKGSMAQSALGPTKQISLVYDDTEPFTNFQPMPYCLQDPRGSSNTDLLTSGVLPNGETSCIVEGNQTVRGNGTPAGAFVDFEFFVYSSYDGSRGMG
jgi:hypothetical protein